MKKNLKSVLSMVLALAMILTGLSIPGTAEAAEPKAGEPAEYQIYPTPHSVVYQDDSLSLTDEVNVVYEDGIDQATKDRLAAVMDSKAILVSTSDQIQDGKVNVLVGVKDSGKAADTYADEHITYAADLFGKVDSYLLSVKDRVVTILGKDTDAAFYGISTLKLIFDQSEGKSIRNLQIEDYAIGQYRGFIEGYYGLPWSVDDRISLMNFGGDFKMNIYIFAPKDDPYHNTQWRDPYPEDKLKDISRMVAAGTASKCRFAWAIHPFMNSAITNANYDESLVQIKSKFQQLYDAGVRQFVISADDASSDAGLQVKLLNDMNQWVKEHEGTYNLVFVPMIYCTAAANWGYGYTLSSYYSALNSVDKDVEFMWTGESVCAPATQNTFDHFKQVSGREPFMWLNWPVNDVNHKRLVMGPAENCILNTGGVTGFKGLVTNPLEQGEASKTSLFAIADYAWNTADFDSETSWADSFQYIDPGAPESLHEMCKHMTNPSPGGITGMAESKEIEPFVTAFKQAYNAGSDLTESGNALTEQLQKIVDAADDFQANGINEDLKDEMGPWVNSLRAVSKAGIGYVKAAMALQNEDDEAAWSNYCVAVNENKISKNCEAPQLEGSLFVESGAKVLMPFTATMENNLKKPMEDLLQHSFGGSSGGSSGGSTGEAALIYNGLGGFYEGDASKITDGNDSTYAWFNEKVGANAYIGFDLGDSYRIDSVKILQGNSDSHGDIFTEAILEYSSDGENYSAIETFSNTNNIEKNLSDLSIVGRYIRIRTPSATGKWYAIREFSVGTSPSASPVYTNAQALESMTANITQNAASVNVTEDPITLAAGEYIGLQMPKIREVTSVKAEYDPKQSLVLEHSLDGVEWTKITEFAPPADMAYLRIRNDGNQSAAFTLTELSLTNSNRDTNFLSTVEYEEGYEPTYAADESLTSAYLAKAGSGAGSLTWRISSPEQIGSVYILTYPNVNSDAEVSVQDTEGAWHKAGALDKNLNIFTDMEQYTAIKSVKVTWKSASPRIQEMYTTSPRTFGVTLNKTSMLLGVDQTASLKASVLVLEGENPAVTWSSDDTDIAEVNDRGAVTGKALGRARITASVENGKYTAYCDVVVSEHADPAELEIKGAAAGSEELTNATATEGPASLAIDGNEDTKWHSLWAGDEMENLWISLDLGDTFDITELQYLPRKDTSMNGTILGEEIYVSTDGKEWMQVDAGTWPESKDWKTTTIATAVPARYVKLAATEISSDKDNAKFASAAEIKILGFEHDENIVDKRYAMAAGFESQITPESKYTADSYKNYKDAWDAVKDMISNVAANQKQVDDAVAAYRKAIEDLKIKATGISVTPSEINLEIGDTQTLTAQVQPADADNRNVTWASDDPDTVSVNADGFITAKKEGTTDIIATSADGGFTGSCTVTVSKPVIHVTGVEISGVPEASMNIGDSIKITAAVQPADATNQEVSWVSDNINAAVIEQDGTLKAVGAGEARITVTTADGGHTRSFTVTVEQVVIPDPEYTVKFNANGGTPVTASMKIKNGSRYGALPQTSRSGYTFLGWYLGEEKIVEGALCSLKADATFTAKWQQIQTPPVVQAPAKVTGLKKKSPTTKTITVYWQKSDGAESYLLERYDTTTKKWKTLPATVSTQVKDSKLKAGTHYKYRVTAINKAGKSSVSASIEAATKPAAVKLTKAERKKGSKKVVFKWKKVKADGYQIDMRIGKGKYQPLRSLKAKAVSYTTKSILKTGKKYSFRMRAYVKVNGKKVYGAYSKVKTFKVK